VPERLESKLEAVLGRAPQRLRRLAGGDVGAVSLAEFEGGERLVVKQPGPGSVDTAEIEARMLTHLRKVSDLPVPEVVHAEPGLLVISYFDGDTALTAAAEADAGRRIAALHAVTDSRFGFEIDTVIGPLHQPNPREEDWLTFFREHRLRYMARLAAERGQLPQRLLERIEAFAEALESHLLSPARPELVHGDLWGGNILAKGDRVAGFIDPALYYGHGEMDLAFITLFTSAGRAFFEAYQEIRPIPEGFFETRRDIYNLWPLLVHVTLFGSTYAARTESILERFGA